MQNEFLDLYHRATEKVGEEKARANLAIVQNLFDLTEKFSNLQLPMVLITFHFIEWTDDPSKWKDVIFGDSVAVLKRVEEARRFYHA